MIGASSSLVAMALLVRFLTPEYHVLELIFLRSVVNLCLMTPWILRAGMAAARTDRLALHGLRNGLLYTGNVAWFFGVTMVTLAELSALQFTMPIFTVVIMAVIAVAAKSVDSAPVRRGRGGGVRRHADHPAARSGSAPGIGPFVVLAAAFFYSVGLHHDQAALGHRIRRTSVVFYMSVFILVFSAIPAAFVWQHPGRRPTCRQIVGLGVDRLHHPLLHDPGDGVRRCELRGAVRFPAPSDVGGGSA